MCHFTPPQITHAAKMLDFAKLVDTSTVERRRRGTDVTLAASAVTATSQNCNYDKVTVIGRLAQGNPAISSLAEIQIWLGLPTNFGNL